MKIQLKTEVHCLFFIYFFIFLSIYYSVFLNAQQENVKINFYIQNTHDSDFITIRNHFDLQKRHIRKKKSWYSEVSGSFRIIRIFRIQIGGQALGIGGHRVIGIKGIWNKGTADESGESAR